MHNCRQQSRVQQELTMWLPVLTTSVDSSLNKWVSTLFQKVANTSPCGILRFKFWQRLCDMDRSVSCRRPVQPSWFQSWTRWTSSPDGRNLHTNTTWAVEQRLVTYPCSTSGRKGWCLHAHPGLGGLDQQPGTKGLRLQRWSTVIKVVEMLSDFILGHICSVFNSSVLDEWFTRLT